MFDKDFRIYGKYATYWKDLAIVPGNVSENSKKDHFKVFENYMSVYMIAPIIGLVYGRKGKIDTSDTSNDSAGMLAEIFIKNQSRLKYIYKLIVLSDDTLGLTDEEKIDMAFREDNNTDAVAKGMGLFHSYFYGGLEVLHEYFVDKCETDDDFILEMFNFADEFNEAQNITDVSIDIDQLLKKSL